MAERQTFEQWWESKPAGIVTGASKEEARWFWEASRAALGLRPELLAFALLMEGRMRDNDQRPGWADITRPRIREGVEKNLKDLIVLDDIRDLHSSHPHIQRHAADLANYVMMYALCYGGLTPYPKH